MTRSNLTIPPATTSGSAFPPIGFVFHVTKSQRRRVFKAFKRTAQVTRSMSQAYALTCQTLEFVAEYPKACSGCHEDKPRRPLRLWLYEDQAQVFEAILEDAMKLCGDEGCAVVTICEAPQQPDGSYPASL